MAKIMLNMPSNADGEGSDSWIDGGWLPDLDDAFEAFMDGKDLIVDSPDAGISVRFTGKGLGVGDDGEIETKGQLTGFTIYAGSGGEGESLGSVSGLKLELPKLLAFIEKRGADAVAEMILSSDDEITGSDADDDFNGFKGNDVLSGEGGNDMLYGAQGKDRLFGGSGDDALIGGKGSDVLFGGEGADTFVFLTKKDSGTQKQKRDVIRDFEDDDKIDLTAFNLTGTDDEDSAESEDGFEDDFEDEEDEEIDIPGITFVTSKNDTIVRIDLDDNGRDDMAILVKNRAVTMDDLLI
jgi:serralysin